ncbi:MAG: hypothetical protein WDN49_18935 [Acetobacteraceae bacterium]
MVLLTAVLTVLPLALAAPGGADDVAHLRNSLTALFNSGLPSSPGWLPQPPARRADAGRLLG